jgi:hypothetical protein
VQSAANGGFEPEVIDAAACTFLHEGRIADLRCALHKGLLCGQRVNSLQMRQRLVSALSHIRRNVSLETTGGFLSSAAAAPIIAFGPFDYTLRNQHSPYF